MESEISVSIPFGGKKNPFEVVLVSTVNEATTKRFALAFVKVAKRIPVRDRNTIIEFWKSASQWDTRLVKAVPEVTLHNEAFLCDGEPDKNTYAMVNDKGMSITFAGEVAASAPDFILVELIAHELAHVFQYAIGHESLHNGQDEIWAIYLETIWGFHTTRVRAWYTALEVNRK